MFIYTLAYTCMYIFIYVCLYVYVLYTSQFMVGTPHNLGGLPFESFDVNSHLKGTPQTARYYI